jgi:pyrimidine operon attenuation protein/uracil phosphoribosyltransferase
VVVVVAGVDGAGSVGLVGMPRPAVLAVPVDVGLGSPAGGVGAGFPYGFKFAGATLVAGGLGSPSAGLLQPEAPKTAKAKRGRPSVIGVLGTKKNLFGAFMDEIMMGVRRGSGCARDLHHNFSMATVLMDAEDMRRTLQRMAHEILEANHGTENLVVVGVLRRGYPIAKRLAFLMTQIEGTTVPCGKVDARRYRDDGKRPDNDQTEVPFQITGKTVILVDEVVFTARTARAALDAVMGLGRPERVQLAVLVDRGHRELPIEPNYTGRTIFTDRTDRVTVKVNEIDGEDAVVLDKAPVA